MKGLPFREAHEVVGKMVTYCIDKKCELKDIPMNILKKFSPFFRKDVYEAMSLDVSVKRKKSRGGTAPNEVTGLIQRLK